MKNTKDIKNEGKRNKGVLTIVLLVMVLIYLLIIAIVAYAKYTTEISARGEADVANVACTMDIIQSEPSKEIVNPYCIVKVKNYDEKNISEVGINFEITVTPKDEGTVLPEYYWYKGDTIISQSGKLTDTILVSDEKSQPVKKEQEYKIVFLNPGDKDITKKIDFELTSTQDVNE